MHTYTTAELRAQRPLRRDFPVMPRRPIAFVLDNLVTAANVGTTFRLAGACWGWARNPWPTHRKEDWVGRLRLTG